MPPHTSAAASVAATLGKKATRRQITPRHIVYAVERWILPPHTSKMSASERRQAR